MPCYVPIQLPECTARGKNSGFRRVPAAMAMGCGTAMVSSLLLTSRITPLRKVQAAQEESVMLLPQIG
jgi:hypothetical protein